jgi:hypothetical protein
MQIRVAGGPKLHALARDIRRAKGTIRRELAAGLRAPTKAVEQDIKHAIETADMRGRRTGSRRRFREQIPSKGVKKPTSRAVESKVSTSSANPRAEVTLRESRVPARIRALIPYWGGFRTRLRHPVMGMLKTWAGQRIPDVWSSALKRRIGRYRTEADQALDRIRQNIERG